MELVGIDLGRRLTLLQRLGGSELLPHGVAHWYWAGVCFDRTCRLHRAASALRGGFGQTRVGADLFGFFSHDPDIRWHRRCHLHGPLPSSTGKTALEPPSTPRQSWQLDHRSEHLCHDRRSLPEIARYCCRGRPCGRSDCSPSASSGLQPEHYRRVPTHRLELRMCIDPCRSVTTIAFGLWRPEHATADTSLREGLEIMKTNAAPPPTPGDRLLVLPCGGRGNRRYAAFAPHDTVRSRSVDV